MDTIDEIISTIEKYGDSIKITLASAKKLKIENILDVTDLLSDTVISQIDDIDFECTECWTDEDWVGCEVFKWLVSNDIKYNMVFRNDIFLSNNEELDFAIDDFLGRVLVRFDSREDLITTKLRWMGK